ncbi:hypothetical protein Tco_0051575 [Tanacetum coccineum]
MDDQKIEERGWRVLLEEGMLLIQVTFVDGDVDEVDDLGRMKKMGGSGDIYGGNLLEENGLEMEEFELVWDFPKSVQAFLASRVNVRREDHHFVQKKWECRMVGNREIYGYDGRRLKRRSDGLFHDHFRVDGFVSESGKVGMIWSFSVLGVCKSTKILFVCEYGLTSDWDYEDLTELLERDRLVFARTA